MPPDETTTADPATEQSAEKPPETPAFDPTKYVSRDDYDTLRTQLARMEGQLAGVAAGAGRQAEPPRAPERVYTDDELSEMLESGEGRKILAAQRIINQQQMRPLVDEFVTFRGATMITAESLGRDIVEQSGKIPYYKDPEIRRQVDAFMATLPPEARANKESLVLAHNYVVGDPKNVERVVSQRVEEELRKKAGDTKVADATVRGGRVPDSTGSTVPTVRELLGDQAAAALKAQGQTADGMAKRLGFKGGWAEYAAYIEKEQTTEEEVEQ